MPPDSDASAATAPPADGLERTLSRRARAASALRSGTVAAAAAIASVTPHGTGAIDVVMVRDADGATRSSPFYVRFGKYTGARSADRRVAVEVNGKDAGFCMHLGRTGEAWFLAQDEHDWDDRAILSGGAASPLGYSSGDEPSAPPATALGASTQPPRAVVGSAPTRSGEDARAAAAAAASPPPVASRPPRTASSSSLGKPPRAPPPPPAPRSAAASDDDPGLLGGVLSPDPAPRSPLGEAVDGKDGGGAIRPGASPSPQPRSPSPPSRPPSEDGSSSSSSSSDDDDSDNDAAAAAPAAASPPPAAAAPARPSNNSATRAGPTVELALVPPADIVGAPPDAVRAALDAGALTAADWRDRGNELAAHPHLVAVVGGAAVHRWADAAPALAGGLAYGGDWGALLPPPLALAAPGLARADSGSADGGDRAESRLASLRGWLASFRGPGGGPLPLSSTGSMRRPSPLAPDAARDEALASALARAERHRRHRRSFLPTPAQLAALPVSQGRNTVDFVYGRERLRAYIYVLDPRARVVVSDIDGTVTRSDMLGHVLPRVGVDWSHGGIARLFTDVAANGYSLLYLSSRSIAQASATRDYLHSVDQGGDRLPAGPVLMSPDGLVPSLYRELILRRPHEFKIRCLEDVRALFPPGAAPFHAGFGNRDTDEVSYLAVGIPPPRTFIINPRGELRRASGGVVTSGTSTLAAVHAIVHDVFPPLPAAKASSPFARSGSAPPVPLSATAAAAAPALPDRGDNEAFNAFNYFRMPPPIVVDSDGEEFCDPEGKA